ncbi:hypothetical protein ElyMa_000049900 [Elysia marginata]|uniref:Uncharacterized protein n=1 Tax=Elysia marginata TaxID=1093978 RepID=A0AAV4EEQ6_9GAST|nr:hypothetical protein ElyMa_000049900 [Elysia marginata]
MDDHRYSTPIIYLQRQNCFVSAASAVLPTLSDTGSSCDFGKTRREERARTASAEFRDSEKNYDAAQRMREISHEKKLSDKRVCRDAWAFKQETSRYVARGAQTLQSKPATRTKASLKLKKKPAKNCSDSSNRTRPFILFCRDLSGTTAVKWQRWERENDRKMEPKKKQGSLRQAADNCSPHFCFYWRGENVVSESLIYLTGDTIKHDHHALQEFTHLALGRASARGVKASTISLSFPTGPRDGLEQGKGESDRETGVLSQALKRANYQGFNFSIAKDMVEYMSENHCNKQRKYILVEKVDRIAALHWMMTSRPFLVQGSITNARLLESMSFKHGAWLASAPHAEKGRQGSALTAMWLALALCTSVNQDLKNLGPRLAIMSS